MPDASADELLIEAVKRGDALAWRELIERFQGRLLSFARRMLAQRAEAEDLVQETLLGLLRSLPTYDGTRPLETYLFAILRNKLHDHFRRAQRGQRQSLEALEAGDHEALRCSDESPSDALAERETVDAQRAALVRSLRQWVEQCRDERRFHELIIVEMLIVVGLRNKEVAADLEIPETAVAGVKFRVLERWRLMTAAHAAQHDWQDADLSRDSTVARIWREEGVSCLKRSTLGRYLLGALDDEWLEYVQFHVESAGCARCAANLDDLRAEDERSGQDRRRLQERFFASSVGFLSHRPDEPQSPQALGD